MKIRAALLSLLSAGALAGAAEAATLSGNFTVKSVFSEQTTIAGVTIVENNFSVCTFNLMYISLNSDTGKAILSLVLTAKAAGWKITRVDYTVNANGNCTISSLHVQ